MLIQFTRSVAGRNFSYREGEKVDLRVDIAKQFVKEGSAVPASDAPETATRSAPESATLPRGLLRRRRSA